MPPAARSANRVTTEVAKIDPSADNLRLLAAFNEAAALFSRAAAARKGRLDPRGRDLDAECGYIVSPTVQDYKKFYERVSVATRAVNLWPDECWGSGFELRETDDAEDTPFESSWKDLLNRCQVEHYLHRADQMSGLGSYGVMFFGLDDGKDFAAPALSYNLDGQLRANSPKSDLKYLRVMDQSLVDVAEYETENNWRFGQPKYYQIDFADPKAQGRFATMPHTTKKVHWTRVLHVSLRRKSSEVFSTPVLEPVLNNCFDIRKISGSSPEMWWAAAFAGMQFVVSPDLVSDAGINRESVAEEIEKYLAGLQRFLASEGGEWKPLGINAAPDPTNPLMAQINLLCAALDVPVRIFLGTESGHLASTQDAATWKERVSRRQRRVLEPLLLKPFVNRMVDYGVLPRPEKLIIEWQDLKTLGDADQADVALKRAQAIMQYVSGDCQQVMPPRMFYTLILGLTDSQATAVEEYLKKNPPPPPIQQQQIDQTAELAKMDAKTQVTVAKAAAKAPPPKPQGGGRTGSNPNRAKTGRPARTAATAGR